MRDLETSVTQKGQVTIPAEMRRRLGLRARDKVIFELEGNVLRLHPVSSSRILRGFGAVSPRNRPENWAGVRDEVEQSISEEAAIEGQR